MNSVLEILDSAGQNFSGSAGSTGSVEGAYIAGEMNHRQLSQAFELFNMASKQLAHSHQSLNDRLEELQARYTAIEEKNRQDQINKSELENQLNHLLQVLPVGVVILDSRGNVSQCNRTAIELLGEPLEGERWLNIINRAFSPQADDGHEVSLKDGRMVGVSTCSLDSRDGQMIVLTDLTETRRLQARIEKNRRVWELGKMSAALAHQIRTPLSSAMLYASQMRNYVLDEAQRNKMCDQILKSLQHLESQVQDILSFVRPHSESWCQLSVEALMSGVERSLSALLLAKKAVLKIDIEPDLDEIHCHQDALQGAIVNLIQNGIESVEMAGKSGIAAVEVCCKKEEGAMVVSIKDNGSGISEQAQSQIFEPFFSTKQNGTGLGLAVVKQVMDAHGVDISIKQSDSSGTAFSLVF